MDQHAPLELDIPMPAPFAARGGIAAPPAPPAFPRLATPMSDALRLASHAPVPTHPAVRGGGPAGVEARPLAGERHHAGTASHADEPVSPAIAAQVVEQATGMAAGPGGVRLISPPSFAYDLLAAEEPAEDDEVDLHALPTRRLLHEALRARLVAVIEQREHRSAYEIVFLLMAFAVTVLLVTPPIVQVLLAARGVQS